MSVTEERLAQPSQSSARMVVGHTEEWLPLRSLTEAAEGRQSRREVPRAVLSNPRDALLRARLHILRAL